MYRNLVGEELVFSEHTVSMRRVAEDVPRWFDQMTADPNRFMGVISQGLHVSPVQVG